MKPHSFVDIITNSSTVIYSTVNESAERNIREAVNSILKIAGSNKEFDDIFEVSVEFESWYISNIKYEWDSMDENMKEAYKNFENYCNARIREDRKEGDYKIIRLVNKATGEKTNVVNLFNAIYDLRAEWDG